MWITLNVRAAAEFAKNGDRVRALAGASAESRAEAEAE
jgi:hypothetical protein